MTYEDIVKQPSKFKAPDGRLEHRVLFDLYDNLNADLRDGYTNLYFITGMHWVKVGLARHTEHRLSTLQVGCPFKLQIAHTIKIPRAFSRQVERHTHKRLKAFAALGEWFAVDTETAIQSASSIVRQAYALCSIMKSARDDWEHCGDPHTGADFIYLVGGADFADKRLLSF